MLSGLRRNLAICGLTAVILVLASCAPTAPAPAPAPAQPAPAKALTRVEFLMPFVPPTEYPYFVTAQEKGFFAAEGLDVVIQEGTGSGNTVKTVGAGSTPIGLADANRILAGRIEGAPITSVGTLYYTSPTLVVSLKDNGITKLEDLIGKKLGDSPSSAVLLTWRVGMARAGLDYNKVDFVAVEPASKIPALISRQVDAITGQSQAADLIAEGVDVNVITIEIDAVADSFIVNDSFLQREPETVRAFMRAALKGVDYVKNNQAEALEYMVKRFPTVDRQKLEMRLKFELGWIYTKNTPTDRFGFQDLALWRNLQDIMLETKQIEKKLEVGEFVKNDYLPYK
jgi:NitT/TauT family transport system substrate-binding protein